MNVADGADATMQALYSAAATQTIADAQFLPVCEPGAAIKKIAWADLKALLGGLYAALSHDHGGSYSAAGHDHDARYAGIAHGHSSQYSSTDHSHGNITSDGRLGSTPNLPLFTAAGGNIAVKSVEAAREALGIVPAVCVFKTLAASGWSGGAQELTDAAITGDCAGDVKISQAAQSEQFLAWCRALPQVTAQAEGSITITCRGTVPEIDIPVMVEVRK